MPELETVHLRGIEVFDVGTWNGSGYTDADLDGMIAAFTELKGSVDPPAKLGQAKLGHDEDQALLNRSGFPAAGWVEKLYRKGTQLVADISRVPKTIGDLIRAGAYRKISSEVLIDATFNGKQYPLVFSGLAFLGEELPAVTTLGDIVDLYSAHFASGGKAKVITEIAPKAQKEAHMTNADETAALVADVKRLGANGRLASFAQRGAAWLRSTLKRFQNDPSMEEKQAALQEAISTRFSGLDGYGPWIVSTYDDRAIVQRDGEYWAVPYTVAADGSVTLGDAYKVEQAWTTATTEPAPAATDGPAPAPTDSSGQTTTEVLKRKEKEQMKTIAHALGLKDDATETEIVAAIGARPTTEQFTKIQTEVTDLKEHNLQADATTAVDAAIRAKKVAPASRETMLPFARNDPKGFAAFLEKAPAIFTGASGSDADAPAAKSAADEINAKVVEAMQKDPSGKLTFAAALENVSRANPDLARKYVEERGSSARLS